MEMEKGKIKWYNPEKRFGFIIASDGSDVFLHASRIDPGSEALEDGDPVEFIMGRDHKGRQRANRVRKVLAEAAKSSS